MSNECAEIKQVVCGSIASIAQSISAFLDLYHYQVDDRLGAATGCRSLFLSMERSICICVYNSVRWEDWRLHLQKDGIRK